MAITISNDVTRIFPKYEAISVGSSLTGADSGKIFKVSGSGGTADVMEGSLIVAGAVVDVDAADQINFVHGSSNLGDFIDIWSDGSNYYVFGNALSSGALTATG